MTQTSAAGAESAELTRDTVLAERRGAVLILTLNRPARLNAWNDQLEQRYFELLDEADAEPQVRAIVVTGAGRGFCAGADMADLKQAGDGEDIGLGQRSRPRSYPLTIRKPMIAAINGAAVGLGLVEALYCDLRFAVPGAKLATTFARRGLIAEYGMAWILPRLIGQSRAMDLLLSGRTILGEEALSVGLVDRVVEAPLLLDEAVAYATELATYSSPTSMSVIKGQVQRALDSDFATAEADSERLLLESFAGTDVAEGVASYEQRRAPRFAALGPK